MDLHLLFDVVELWLWNCKEHYRSSFLPKTTNLVKEIIKGDQYEKDFSILFIDRSQRAVFQHERHGAGTIR